MSADKAALRAQALAARAAGGDGAALDRHLSAVLASHAGAVLAGYWPMRGEADPRPALAAHDGPVVLPVVTGPARPLVFRLWQGGALEPGPFGTAHPPESAPVLTPSVLIVPLAGWTPVEGNANLWTDEAGACLLREDRSGQALPTLGTQEAARTFALRLQKSLGRSGVREIVTQPVERAGTWAVLAAYTHEEGGVAYRISQLYLSDAGLLRTVTGSSAQYEARACVNAMRDFLRYRAN